MSSTATTPGALSRTENVPAKLKRLTFWAFVLIAVFCVSTMIGYGEHRFAIKTVGDDAAPSVFLAHDIKNDVLNMDASIVNYLIAKPGENYAAFKDFIKYRAELTDKQVQAAQNITFGDAEKVPLTKIQEGMVDYEVALQSARDKHEQGDFAFLASYRQALDVLESRILPAADDLEKANADALASAYNHQSAYSWLTLSLNFVSGLVLVGFLLYTQSYLRRRFKTSYSGLICAGIILAGSFTVFTSVAYLNESRHLYGAKEKAYDSIVSLMDARALAYDANAARVAGCLMRRCTRSTHSSSPSASLRWPSLQSGVSFAVAENEAKLHASMQRSTMVGKLAEELNNITFDGERDAATETLHWFGVYVGIDAQIRQLENSGHHADAVALAIGSEPNQSNWAFDNFDKALGKALQINQTWFDSYVASAKGDIAMIWEIALAQSILQALLFIFALRPRTREYPV